MWGEVLEIPTNPGQNHGFQMISIGVVMATQQFFTQQQIEEAKTRLENLPDLSPTRITRNDALENLRSTILMLAKEKGYTVKDIKSALDSMKFVFSERSISEILKEDESGKKRQGGKLRRKSDSVKNAAESVQQQK